MLTDAFLFIDTFVTDFVFSFPSCNLRKRKHAITLCLIIYLTLFRNIFKNIEAEIWSKIRTNLEKAEAGIRNIDILFVSRSCNAKVKLEKIGININ